MKTQVSRVVATTWLQTHRRGFAIWAAIVLSSALVLFSGQPAQAQFTAEQAQYIAQAEISLNRISTAVGRFLQISNEGNVARGDFFLHRPGRLRFDYDPPSPLVLVADGRNIVEVDEELRTTRQRSLSNTPLRLFLSQNVDLRNQVNLVRVEEVADSILITMQDRSRPNDGVLTLVLDRTNFTLRAWQIVDGNGERTTVRLENMTYGVQIAPNFFVAPNY